MLCNKEKKHKQKGKKRRNRITTFSKCTNLHKVTAEANQNAACFFPHSTPILALCYLLRNRTVVHFITNAITALPHYTKMCWLSQITSFGYENVKRSEMLQGKQSPCGVQEWCIYITGAMFWNYYNIFSSPYC